MIQTTMIFKLAGQQRWQIGSDIDPRLSYKHLVTSIIVVATLIFHLSNCKVSHKIMKGANNLWWLKYLEKNKLLLRMMSQSYLIIFSVNSTAFSLRTYKVNQNQSGNEWGIFFCLKYYKLTLRLAYNYQIISNRYSVHPSVNSWNIFTCSCR